MPKMDKFNPQKHGGASALGRREILTLLNKEAGLSFDILEMAVIEKENGQIRAFAFMEHSDLFLRRCMDAAALLACAVFNPQATLRPHIRCFLTSATENKNVPPGTDLEIIAKSLESAAPIQKRFGVQVLRRDTGQEIARSHVEVDPFASATYSPYEKIAGKISRGLI